MLRRWVRIVGDGPVYSGRCLLHSVTLYGPGAGDSVIVYDGRDSISGKLFARFLAKVVNTEVYNFGVGVPFDQGIYLDGNDSEVETTVVFTPQ